MSPSESDLLSLIGVLYDAVERPSLWPDFLGRFASTFAAPIAFVQWHDLSRQSSQMIAAVGLTTSYTASYNAHYSRLNVWRDDGRRLYVAGHAVLDQDMCPRMTLVKSEFYNDYLRPMDGVYCAAGVLVRDGDRVLTLACLRSQTQSSFEEQDRAAIVALLPHLTRAHNVGMQIQFQDSDDSLANGRGTGLVFLGAAMQVIRCNRAAERLLASDDGLTVQNGMLRARFAGDDTRLRQAVRQASAARLELTAPAGIAISRPSGKRPLHVIVAPLRHGLPRFAGMKVPHVALTIVDPARSVTAIPAVLIGLFGLTPREAAVASALSSGHSVEQAATRLGITYETARSHLRRVFEKTGTSRQAELVALLARLPHSLEH